MDRLDFGDKGRGTNYMAFQTTDLPVFENLNWIVRPWPRTSEAAAVLSKIVLASP
jgi:hypothetical protein